MQNLLARVALFIVVCGGIFSLLTDFVQASFEETRVFSQEALLQSSITLQDKDISFVIDLRDHPEWIKTYTKYYYHGFEFVFSENLSSSGTSISSYNEPSFNIASTILLTDSGSTVSPLHKRRKRLPVPPASQSEISRHPHVMVKELWGLDTAALRDYINEHLAPLIYQETSDVTINKDEHGNIVFDGVGKDGRKIDITKTLILFQYALKNNIKSFSIPFIIEKANVTVIDPSLQHLGLKEIIAVGTSGFAGSPYNRRHNIAVGSQKLSGILIGSGSVFSLAEHIGSVDKSTGYKPELVIKGSKTIPEYGGGLCQVSSTIYRAGLNAGMDIVNRLPHSYAVSYYKPWGTDATVYPPSVDLKFRNNTPGAFLTQSYIEGNYLNFVFYGTSDGRSIDHYGPFITNWKPALPTKREYTAELPPGEEKVVGGAHPGFKATWYRYVTSSTGSIIISETIHSLYQARPLYIMIGQEQAPTDIPNENSGDQGNTAQSSDDTI